MKTTEIQWKPMKINNISEIRGQPCNIRVMESIDRVPKHLRHYQKWIPRENLHRSYGAEVLATPNSRRARPFCIRTKKNTAPRYLKKIQNYIDI